MSYQAGACLLPGQAGQVVAVEPDTIVRDYLDRRAQIGLDFRPDAALFVDLRAEPVTAEQLEKYLIYARTVRLSLEANGSLCSALLEAKKVQKQAISSI